MRKIFISLLVFMLMVAFSSTALAQRNQRVSNLVPVRVTGAPSMQPVIGDCRLCRTDQFRRNRGNVSAQWWNINGVNTRNNMPRTQPGRVTR